MKSIEDVVITINGVELNNAQRVTVCAAIDTLDGMLSVEPNPLSGSELMEAVGDGYRKNIVEIQNLIMGE
jgi:hypothetical protein